MPRRSSKRRKPNKAAAVARESVTTGRFLSRRAELLILAVLVTAAVIIAHWPILEARALTFDDQSYLTHNPLVQRPSWASARRFLTEVLAPSSVQGYYQPLAMISLMLDYAVAGSVDNLKPFHAASLILHLANTLLVMWLLYALFGRPWIAAAVALLFGVHPMTVEPIAWIGERKTVLATFFAFCSLLAYIRYAKKDGSRHYLTSLGLYVLALLAKPTTTPLPIVLLLLDFWPLNRLSRRAVLEKIPFLVVGGVFAVITVISQATTANVQIPVEHSFIRSILVVCHGIVFYLVKIIWPTNLTSHYPIPDPLTLSNPTILVGVIGTCVLVSGLVWSLRRTRSLLTGWLIFIMAIFPTLGVVGFTTVLTADKYAYLPAIGYLLVLAWLFDNVAGRDAKGKPTWRESALAGGVLMAALLFVIGTRNYLQEWQTTKRHHFYVLRLAPNSAYTHNDCGNIFAEEGDYVQAISYFDKAIELNSAFVNAYLNRGIAYKNMGNFAQAISDYSRSLEINPKLAEGYNNRGNAYLITHEYDRAISDYNRAIELNPDLPEAYNNRGMAYDELEHFDRALQNYAKAIELRPAYAEAYYNRGNIYMDMGDLNQAIREYSKAIELNPGYANAYHNRAVAYYKLQQFNQAWEDLQKCQKTGGRPKPEVVQALSEAAGQSQPSQR